MLGKAQRKLRDTVLALGEGAHFAMHLTPTSGNVYRLFTADYRPIINVRRAFLNKMIDRGYFMATQGRIGRVYIPAPSLHETVAEEKAKAEAKEAKRKTVRG